VIFGETWCHKSAFGTLLSIALTAIDVVLSTFDPEIATQKRFRHVDVLQLNMHLVGGPVAGLLPNKFASGAQKRRAVGWKHL
jgi:hypothetical protein